MNYLLDTNIISELIAKRPSQRVIDWVDARDPDSIYLSVITIGEIQKGIAKLPTSDRRDALQAWLEGDLLARFYGRILPLTTEVLLRWGKLVGELERVGRPLPAIDSLLAALALQHGHALVTRNAGDFADAGVVMINPWGE
ncbi:type II toxin-antitoxin system VapC family toxin [Oscillochloris sp. ZM17-4]|uniref:type II toxin-antitoxin system VapC family toxin n=1 Tax=Oscillochloris sp. ZM17-4 TaxID=2866714 RepID=UPI001C72EDEC|nr:type II toxin-antitoxin system VapC family toxin [Oscillochloris sp. ZM17-4]MBX0330117.1 type II toxin-antitoxin system VapC family toxin [Oscillochloris sp. ZM17-4]